MKKNLLLILIWLWLTMGLMALFIQPLHAGAGFINQTRPFNFLDFSSLVLFIESSKLFFILIILPLIINLIPFRRPAPQSIPDIANTGPAPVDQKPSHISDWLSGLKYFIIIILLSLPLTILTLYLSQIGIWPLLRTNLELLLAATFIIILSFQNSAGHLLFYYLALFLLYGVGPILYYLVLELAQSNWSVLIIINPFWLFWNIGNPGASSGANPAWLVQCLIWITLIIITLATNRISKRN